MAAFNTHVMFIYLLQSFEADTVTITIVTALGNQGSKKLKRNPQLVNCGIRIHTQVWFPSHCSCYKGLLPLWVS